MGIRMTLIIEAIRLYRDENYYRDEPLPYSLKGSNRLRPLPYLAQALTKNLRRRHIIDCMIYHVEKCRDTECFKTHFREASFTFLIPPDAPFKMKRKVFRYVNYRDQLSRREREALEYFVWKYWSKEGVKDVEITVVAVRESQGIVLWLSMNMYFT